MNQACVSLEEVLAAASGRAASLVPETSGYLALAIADATSRLPYAHEDRGVLLTIDGSVMVPRKAPIAAPPEAARVLRDLLRRLLAASNGSMPGLASASRPRSEEHDVDRVVSDIEAALIPVNRAAAKRALARLSRETLRAKELGKLKKKTAPPPAPTVATSAASSPKATQPPVPPRPATPPPEQRSAMAAPVPAPAPAPIMAVEQAPIAAPAPSVVVAPVPAPITATAPSVVVAPIPAPIEAIAAPPASVHVAPPALVVAPPPHVEQAQAMLPVVHVERAPEIAPPPMVVVAPVFAATPASPIVVAPAPVFAATPAAPILANAVLAPEPYAFTPTPFEIDVEMSGTPAGSYVTAIIPDLATDLPPNTTDAPPSALRANDALHANDVAPAATEALLTLHTPTLWNDNDATIADPDAMAVIKAIYQQGHLASGASPTGEPALTDAHDSLEARAVSPSPDDAILTRPMHAAVAPRREYPAAPEISEPPPRVVRRPTEFAVPDALTSEAAPVALLAHLEGSRADELLDAFQAEDQGDRAVSAAAHSLRAFAEVDEPSAPRPHVQRPTFLRVSAPPRRGGPPLPDIDDDLPLPAPRARKAAPTRWPLALFAVGVLVLFAAWIYRPTLAHDFFGLTTLLRPAAAPAAESTPRAADTSLAATPRPPVTPSTPAGATPAAPETPAAIPQRSRDPRAAAASADGTRRRRD